MIFYTSPWACIIIAFILILHVLALLSKSLLSKALVYVNIGLHISLFLLLFFIGAEISELAVMFMGSLAVYISLSYFLSFKNRKDNGEGGV